MTRALAALFVAGLLLGCDSRSSRAAYSPQVREITLTAVPLLTRELRSVYPFLEESFGPNGVLEGKEIYAFVPSTVTAVEGDTLHFTLVNPEDDEHKFVLEDLVVGLPGQSVQRATWLAKRAGVFTFSCVMPSHVPYMYGQLVILSAASQSE